MSRHIDLVGSIDGVVYVRKQEPGSGGEHRDPGWLFRAYGEGIRRSGDVPDHAGERITHSPVVTPACLQGVTASGNSNAATELKCGQQNSWSVAPQGLKPESLMARSGTPEGVPFQNNC